MERCERCEERAVVLKDNGEYMCTHCGALYDSGMKQAESIYPMLEPQIAPSQRKPSHDGH